MTGFTAAMLICTTREARKLRKRVLRSHDRKSVKLLREVVGDVVFARLPGGAARSKRLRRKKLTAAFSIPGVERNVAALSLNRQIRDNTLALRRLANTTREATLRMEEFRRALSPAE